MKVDLKKVKKRWSIELTRMVKYKIINIQVPEYNSVKTFSPTI